MISAKGTRSWLWTPSRRLMFSLVTFVVLSIAAYLVLDAIYRSVADESKQTLIAMSLSFKIISLIALSIVNGHVLHGVDRNHRDVTVANGIILTFSVIILVALFFEWIAPHWLADQLRRNGSDPAKFGLFLYNGLHLWSLLPLVGYTFLDVYIAFIKPYRGFAEERILAERRIARNYLLYVDVICIIPLATIFAAPLLFTQGAASAELELYFAGGMTLALLSSAFATRVVHIYNS